MPEKLWNSLGPGPRHWGKKAPACINSTWPIPGLIYLMRPRASFLPSGRKRKCYSAEPRCLGEILHVAPAAALQMGSEGLRKQPWGQREEMKKEGMNLGMQFSFPSLGAARGCSASILLATV